ncbi:phosphoribosylglycinamide formyltransferase [Amorphus orientalis]|uniref:Phosphoribosylglycinamide formyltransferase n=1 Tax=Amorphus orientalis TaxID=649198 RepID=A0AAE3VPA8_9HYPH|nr:phosphoribosylglycinamide formyltransferase [Amorphus orientalis]MDQ0315721.1 phosphoribosylglycinamide formyltransferase-1 [Amorphus orientalis]
MSARRVPVAVLISGRGSNMAALIEAARDPAYPAEIVRVISNRPGTQGLQTATDAGIETAVVDHKACPTKAEFETALATAIEDSGAELICLAGFMRVLSADFVARFAGRILNIHPSLLPAFTGLDTHERALTAGVAVHGCTVHIVNAELDAGPILIQAAVPVAADDTAASLSARVLAEEHRIYPAALAAVARGDLKPVNGRIVRKGLADLPPTLVWPDFPNGG